MIIDITTNLPTAEQLAGWGITSLVFDSREASSSTLFCALEGLHTDGHNYIDAARQQGAGCFLVSDKTVASGEGVFLLAPNTRNAMAQLAGVLYDHPSYKLKVVGVTGTDGKSTTSYLIMQLLELAGHPCGLMSTVSLKTGAVLEENTLRQSTPESPQIEAALAQMVQNGLKYAVVEATSHGLAPATARLQEIRFQAGVFTNVTLEHLEFHKTVEQYRSDKAQLFVKVAANASQGAFGVVNSLSEHKALYQKACQPALCLMYGQKSDHLWAENVTMRSHGINMEVCSANGRRAIFLPMVGLFNIENALAALATVAQLLAVEPLTLASLLEQVKSPVGRMVVVQSEPFTVVVDYAHTPGAFEQLLPSMRQATTGRLIILFGSGGERDVAKRAIQGALADEYGDVVIVTEEDPRLEDEHKILNDIATGVKNKQVGESLFLIPRRREAIAFAFKLAAAGDTVLLLGKGHEGSIIGPLGKTPWDETAVAKELLCQMMK